VHIFYCPQQALNFEIQNLLCCGCNTSLFLSLMMPSSFVVVVFLVASLQKAPNHVNGSECLELCYQPIKSTTAAVVFPFACRLCKQARREPTLLCTTPRSRHPNPSYKFHSFSVVRTQCFKSAQSAATQGGQPRQFMLLSP